MERTKQERLDRITALLSQHTIGSQKELLSLLINEGFEITQATLSRDIKELKISKSPNQEGSYIYSLPATRTESIHPLVEYLPGIGISIEFSGHLGVIKTPPGYAAAIALNIDKLNNQSILGTIAGDDTILLIPREGHTREEIIDTLNHLNSFISK